MFTIEFPTLDYVLPILVVHQHDVAKSFEGTGVVVAPGLFMTCWHCVHRFRARNAGYWRTVAHRTETLLDARATATQGLSVRDYLRRVSGGGSQTNATGER